MRKKTANNTRYARNRKTVKVSKKTRIAKMKPRENQRNTSFVHTHTHIWAHFLHMQTVNIVKSKMVRIIDIYLKIVIMLGAADSKSICDIHKSVCNMHGWLSFTYTQPNQVQTCDFLLNFFLFVGSSCMAYPCFRIWAMMREKLETSGNNASTFIGGKTI